MNLTDLTPYFELFRKLKSDGQDVVLNDDLLEKEKEFAGQQITVTGIVNEIDIQKNELIITYRNEAGESNQFKKLISNHFFIFSSSDNLDAFIKQFNIQKDDLVQIVGNIISIHRQSAMRIRLTAVSVIEKKRGLVKLTEKKGCFIATVVYGNAHAPEVQRFYELRDQVLSKSFAGRMFIKFYYFVSPAFASWINDKPRIKFFIRKNILDKLLKWF